MTINYYEELDIDPSADLDALSARIREQRRRYRQLTGSPQPEQRRLAESKIEMLAEAEERFATPESRAAYDQQLAAAPPAPAATVSGTSEAAANSSTDWVRAAQDYLAAGKARNALFAIKEALAEDSSSAHVWTLQAYIALELDDISLADFSVSEANRRLPDNAEILGLMGSVYDRQKRYLDARREFQKAADLEPNRVYWQGRVVWTYADLGQLQEALEKGKALWQRFPNEEYAKSTYAFMLLRDIDNSMSRNNRSLFITNPKQIAHIEARLAEIAVIGSSNEDVISDYHVNLRLVQKAKKRSFVRPSGFMIFSIIGHTLVGAWILLFLCTQIFPPSIGVIIWLLINALLIFIVFQKMWPITWKQVRKNAGEAAKTGLQ